MEHFSIVANTDKDVGYEVANKIKSILEGYGKRATIVSDASQINQEIGAEMAIILGGDGTMIQAAKVLAKLQIPILGVNLGTLGFLTEVEKNNLPMVLDQVVRGEYHVQKRIALEGTGIINGEKKDFGIAMNDFIIGKRGFGRMITTEVYVNDELVDRYVADGILIATPTGSTAYNLSAGGPVMSPQMEGFIITPICPHSLNKRSILVSSSDRIGMKVCRTREGMDDLATLSVDGQLLADAKSGDTIEVCLSKVEIPLVKTSDTGFFERMRSKLTRA